MAIQKGKIVTVTSVKGGVGKTTTTLNLAGILAQMQQKVLLIDFDFYTGSIAASLNIDSEKDIYVLIDDMSNNRFDYLENYVVSYHEFIDVLGAPKDPRYARKMSPKFLRILLTRASSKYDVILIDTNHILSDVNLLSLDMSDHILYVMTNDFMNLKNMATMISIYKDMGKKNYQIILNESIDKTRNYFNTYDIKNIMKDNIDYTIPATFFLKNIDRYVLAGSILTFDKKIQQNHKKTMKNFALIAQSILKDAK